MCLSQGGNAYEVVLLRALWGRDNRLRSDSSDCRVVDLSAVPPTPAGLKSNISLPAFGTLGLYWLYLNTYKFVYLRFSISK